MKKLTLLSLFVAIFFCNQDYDYFGGWPVNPSKNNIDNPDIVPNCVYSNEKSLMSVGCECASDRSCESGKCYKGPGGPFCLPAPGTIFPRFKLIDQFGEDVDLYDFSGHGKLIAIEISAAWCSPCKQLSNWIANGNDEVTRHKQWKPEYNKVKLLVDNGDIFFINVQVSDPYKEAPSLGSIEAWYQEYEDENVPILADINGDFRNWVKNSAFPTIILLNDKMEIVEFSQRGWQSAFGYLSKLKLNEEGHLDNE
ncbi:MAG: hypothetical protein CMG00_04765 [Candidatus Marinimicrobia bacterium]|nr:hypothetical protein [Candidatus Neomarinimicrobiota bacterium]|tara:strand:+ start:2557 stop:3315 length:759 start_codon:yes stop_codon:yes gene_type:complete